jgi:hypothetical protein
LPSIEFEFYEQAAAASEAALVEPEAEPSAPAEKPRAKRTERPLREPANRQQLPDSAREGVVTSAPVALEPEAVVASETQPAQMKLEAAPSAQAVAPKNGLDLSPLAAALTMRNELAMRFSCGVTSAGKTADCTEGREGARSAGAHDQLGTGPRSLIAMRKELKLRPHADGSYGFDSPSFHATVTPDGRVMFEDKVNDLNSFVEHNIVGAQINTSEKRRFMASTAALREQLAEAAEAANQRRAKVSLQSTLRGLLTNATLSLAQKRSAIFGLWDDCASDASGSEAQAAIESFVRDRLPEGSPLAYSAAELSQLNRQRVSRRAFDPYAAADAGVRPG